MTDIVLRPMYYASVSGGKDSLYMLKLILSHLDRYRLDGVVHFELEIDYPFVKNVIDYMESECNRYGIPFYRIRPRLTFADLYEKYGYPTRKSRWCNQKYKLDARLQLQEHLRAYGCKPVFYIGYCYDEVKRYAKRKDFEIYPLVDYQIIEDFILDWARNVPMFNDYYKYNDRCGCMYCPLQSVKSMAYLRLYYPEHYERMMHMVRETELHVTAELGRPFAVFQSNPKYNVDYYERIVENKYMPRLLALKESFI